MFGKYQILKKRFPSDVNNCIRLSAIDFSSITHVLVYNGIPTCCLGENLFSFRFRYTYRCLFLFMPMLFDKYNLTFDKKNHLRSLSFFFFFLPKKQYTTIHILHFSNIIMYYVYVMIPKHEQFYFEIIFILPK